MSDPNQSIQLPTSKRGWRDLMQALGIRPSKGLGQNFLTESGVVDRMVRFGEIKADDLVIEVGPGLGILANGLLQRTANVIAIERDQQLADHIQNIFANSSLKVVHGDAFDVEVDELTGGRPYVLVSNLPYSSGAAIVRRFLEDKHPPASLVIMLQREVAERMVASPPEMTVLGVATQFYTTGSLLFTVPPEVFLPSPKVESAVLRLETRSSPLLPVDEHDSFFRLVNAGFHLKRKTIANSLANELKLEKAVINQWLHVATIDPMRRAETLTIEEWLALNQVADLVTMNG